MSKLQKTLDALSADEADDNNPCFSTGQHLPTLVVEGPGGRRWTLPWQHFLNAEHDAGSDSETLLLCFATHEVTIIGRNLAPLADEIARFRLEILREAPRKYAKSNEDEPFVAEIRVRVAASEAAEKSQKTRVLS